MTPRIGGGGARHLESARIETKPLSKHKTLSQRQTVEAKDQIERELNQDPAVRIMG
jgi:hypothetical protein